ncbi:MAG TPA: CopD family protein [Acetobacteraceae bacterium]|nr:CopD family protein [Acetobacteraceae bacterium]
MYPATSPWGWVLAVHILCIVIWVGGMFFALTVLRPAVAALEPAQRIAFHNRIFRRFFLVIWHVMPIALLSGYVMVVGAFGGFASLPWNINAMQAIGWIMAAIFVWIVFGPYRRFRAAVSTARAAEAIKRIRRLIVINLVLGVLNIFLAAI